MSPLITRVPGGIPAGGQFAATAHAEPGISLGSAITESQIQAITNARQDSGEAVIDLTEGQLAAVRSHIDQTGDFSYRGVRKAAEEAYFAENRYTPEEYTGYVADHGDTSNYFGDPNALRRDIEQARKNSLGTGTSGA